jgi:hypothetical protein
MADEKWRSALGQHAWRDRINFDIQYPDNKNLAFTSAENGLGCLRCSNPRHLDACSNCGNQAFKLGIGTDGVTGLFCNRCRKGFTSWKCYSCGTDNPITHETVLTAGGGGACFVATAAFGDALSPEVLYLSAFRDDVLTNSLLGRAFIRVYYSVSPPLAVVIAKSAALKSFSRLALLRPIIFVLRKLVGGERV